MACKTACSQNLYHARKRRVIFQAVRFVALTPLRPHGRPGSSSGLRNLPQSEGPVDSGQWELTSSAKTGCIGIKPLVLQITAAYHQGTKAREQSENCLHYEEDIEHLGVASHARNYKLTLAIFSIRHPMLTTRGMTVLRHEQLIKMKWCALIPASSKDGTELRVWGLGLRFRV